MTPERENEIKELSQRPDIYDTLADSLAPSIFGNEDIKKGILLQLIGASEKVCSDSVLEQLQRRTIAYSDDLFLDPDQSETSF